MATSNTEVSVTVPAEHADAVRRQIALKCSTAAENLEDVAGNYGYSAEDPSEFRSAVEDMRRCVSLLDAVHWDRDGESRDLTGPREQLRDLFKSGLRLSIERLDEVRSDFDDDGRRPSENAHRKAEEIRLFEELLDQVGWPEDEEGGN